MLPASDACCIICFANISLFHQLKSASRRQIARSLWTNTFPIIFSRSSVSPLPQQDRATPFLAHIDSFAACKNKRWGSRTQQCNDQSVARYTRTLFVLELSARSAEIPPVSNMWRSPLETGQHMCRRPLQTKAELLGPSLEDNHRCL